MGRTSRNNMKNSSFFHIMVQGINQEKIFENRRDKERYLNQIYTNNEGINIIAYCIMDNHAHILIQINEIKNIETWMRKSNISYAMYYNRKNNRVGYVFRDRYKLQTIKNEKHLYLCVEYIHNNPVKALICKEKGDYEFSSYAKIYQKSDIQIYKNLEKILKQCNMQIQTQESQNNKFELIEDEKIDKEQICKKVVYDYLNNRKLSIEELKGNEEFLIELIRILKYEKNISFRIMGKVLKISREKLRRLMINNEGE